MKLKQLIQLLQLLIKPKTEAINMYTVKALEPQLNDDPQALFAIVRDDDVLVLRGRNLPVGRMRY